MNCDFCDKLMNRFWEDPSNNEMAYECKQCDFMLDIKDNKLQFKVYSDLNDTEIRTIFIFEKETTIEFYDNKTINFNYSSVINSKEDLNNLISRLKNMIIMI